MHGIVKTEAVFILSNNTSDKQLKKNSTKISVGTKFNDYFPNHSLW